MNFDQVIPQPAPQRESKPEIAEQKQGKTLFDRIKIVDDTIFTKLRAKESGSTETVERIKTLEALSNGAQKKRQLLGDIGVSVVRRVEYAREGGGNVIAFQKDAKGGSLDKDGTPLVYSVSEDKFHRNENDPPSDEQRQFMRAYNSQAFQDEYAIQLAKANRIPAEDFEAFKASLKQERFSPKIDIPVEGIVPREVAMSRVDMLCRFDVIPPTSAREQDRLVDDPNLGTKIVKELSSVQEGVKSTDKERPARYLYAHEFDGFMEKPPAEWSKVMGIESSTEPQESMTRLATLDWLMGSQDRHFENLFIDPVSGKVTGIDNGLICGRARDLEMRHGKEVQVIENGKRVRKKEDPTEAGRILRSIPLEIMNKHQDLKLSPRDQEQMKNLFEAIYNGGPEQEVIWQTFKMMFDDLREAKVQLAKFMIRLKHVADHGRPGVTTGEVFPIGEFTKHRFEKQQEKSN